MRRSWRRSSKSMAASYRRTPAASLRRAPRRWSPGRPCSARVPTPIATRSARCAARTGEGAMALPPGSAAERAREDASWLELAGKTGEPVNASPVYRMRISGHAPGGLTALPKDARPPNLERGAAIMGGKWRFGRQTVETPPGHAPWGPPFPSAHFADRIHRFHWLRDVASQDPEGEARARSLAGAWVETFGKWDSFAWRLGPTADRVINLMCAGPWLLGGLEGEARTALLDALARQLRHLQASSIDENDPQVRFRIGVALSLAGAAIESNQKALEAGLQILEAECAAQ